MDDIVSSYIIEDELPEPRRSTGTAGQGGPERQGRGAPDPDFFARCSILIPCNLPVHAGLWLGQFANLLAREEGPLALIRLNGKTCETEVFGEGIDPPEFTGLQQDALFDLMGWLAATVKRVLVVPSMIDGDEDLLVSGLPFQLMTGTDATAIVGTYQRAKGLYMASQNAHQPSPSMGLVMVGAEPGIGQKAAAKVQNCATRFLEANITLDAIVHRMDSMDARERITLGGDSAFEISEILAAIHRVSATPEDAPTTEATYIEQSVLQVIDPEEYAELESVFDDAGRSEPEDLPEQDWEEALEASCLEASHEELDHVTSVLEASIPNETSADHPRVAPPEYAEVQLQPSDDHGVPTDLLAFLSELRPLPIHDFENLIVPGVAYGVDSRQRLHLVVFGADVTALSVAEDLVSIRLNESMLNAVLAETEIGRLAPFSSGGLQRDVLLPESDASQVGLLHRGRYKVHLLIDSESGMRRVNLD